MNFSINDKSSLLAVSIGVSKIDYLILTHTHHDHAANAKRTKDNYSASVIVYQNEAVYLIIGSAVLPQGTNAFTKTLTRIAQVAYSICQTIPTEVWISFENSLFIFD